MSPADVAALTATMNVRLLRFSDDVAVVPATTDVRLLMSPDDVAALVNAATSSGNVFNRTPVVAGTTATSSENIRNLTFMVAVNATTSAGDISNLQSVVDAIAKRKRKKGRVPLSLSLGSLRSSTPFTPQPPECHYPSRCRLKREVCDNWHVVAQWVPPMILCQPPEDVRVSIPGVSFQRHSWRRSGHNGGRRLVLRWWSSQQASKIDHVVESLGWLQAKVSAPGGAEKTV